ncbi:hypothetical protein COC98_28175, partial [Bacillus anthracis]
MNSYLSIILRGGIPIEKVIFIQSVEMKSLYIARMTVSGWLAYIYPGDEPTRPSTLSLKKTWEQNHG